MLDCYDVLGIGFGPGNLSLAIAIEEGAPELSAYFLEAQQNLVWQSGMMLDGSNIQNHPCRDLVSLRNPRSRYSFLNYLFENDRLIEHLNLPMEFPLRKEYAQYIGWVAKYFAHQVDFGTRAAALAVVDRDERRVFQVTAANGAVYQGRTLALAPGRTPYVPAPFDAVRSPRIVHLTSYLHRLRELDAPPSNVAVIGGSQSAVELTLDLAKRFPKARVTNYVRSYSLRSKDHSPFSEESYFPDFTEYYFKADRRSKKALDAYMRPTNYSSADADVLHELYIMIYEQRLDGAQRVFVQGNSSVSAVTVNESTVRLEIDEVHTHQRTVDEVDLVVLATGFRDLGPAERQERFPALLADVIDLFRFDEDGYLVINHDYSLEPVEDTTPAVFLNGLCESTHGIGDSGSFSLLSLRAAAILDGLRKQVPVDLFTG
jgi:L-ornithine N5-monooxygenase